MKSSFCPKYERNIARISAQAFRAEILAIFRSYFGQNDGFIKLFWDLLTFSNFKSAKIWIMFLFYVLSFFKKGDTIQEGTLFKGGYYLRKYGIQLLRSQFAKDKRIVQERNSINRPVKVSNLLFSFGISITNVFLVFLALKLSFSGQPDGWASYENLKLVDLDK